ncbi:MAG: MarR family transcriptional regulator [Atopobiaceae bacterium]|nr:MarR family transcriptional regulator [Atopobiaceae bacterium]
MRAQDSLEQPTSYDPLALDNQLCFPLYAASKELTRRYKPFLDPLGLTYTQYVTMMALWEQDNIPVKDLGKRLYLDSATLTPLLKRLEAHGYVTRQRSKEDERSVLISLTPEGKQLRERALDVPRCMGGCINIDPKDALRLKQLLEKLLAAM